MTATPLIPLCTIADLTRAFSTYGINSHADNDNDADATKMLAVQNDSIIYGSGDVAMYLCSRYLIADLAANVLVNRWAATASLFHLCQVRGNPVSGSLADEYERLFDFDKGILKKMMNGDLPVPGLAQNGDYRPAVSNVRIDRRFRVNQERVLPTISTGGESKLVDRKLDGMGTLPLQ